jgi:hypothetical protein
MVLGGILALALLAAPAHAAVTIGSSLADAPNAGTCQAGALSSQSCTLAAASIPMPSAAAGSVTSPIDGVVVRWRLRTNGSSAFSAAPRIVSGLSRLASGGTVTVAATAGTQEFPARLSIAAGQGVGVDVTTQPALTSAGIVATPVSGATINAWNGSATGPTAQASQELLVSADVEPDADHDGVGDETQDQCPSDASTQGACPKTIVSPGSGGSGSGGVSGAGVGGLGAGGVVSPPTVTAPPPLPVPAGAKKKTIKRRCSRKAKRGHHAKRCKAKKRKKHKR